ncbi:DUF3306 domain-containing protein [Marinobacter sp. HL-58]|uniref:DUF3306 domain-containing protein n=1 Tax=Marinobacter sp. HL-58 TaxID=1479237 RepID=UPI00047F37FA|nr:DUF3306 domain-containing protein [Marinobacter sp. HL-58]KPP99382.1 MAG: protein of unknown function DUF3306 [Marinobacter sp. HL-58]
MAESRLARWSRKKTGAGKKAEPSPPAQVDYEPSPEEQELAINQALPEHEVLEKYGLPDPDAIELGTDIKGFLRKEIPELLRRKALRGLWKSNPVLAVLDGLNDYDEDYTDAGLSAKAVQTLYKVGQGFDRTPKVDEQVGEQMEERVADPEPAVSVVPPVAREKPELEITDEPATVVGRVEPAATRGEALSTGAEAELTPRYRPRMRFDS